MAIDWTITIGNIVTIVAAIGGGAWFAMMLRSDIRIMDNRLSGVEDGVKNVGRVLVALAAGEERMKAMGQRFDDLPCRRADHPYPCRHE